MRLSRPSLSSIAGSLLIGAILFCSTIPASGQNLPTYTFAWRGADLENVLRQFQSRTRLNIVWLPLLVEGKTVYCVAREEPVEEVLRCILRGTGLDYYRRSSGTYVIETSVQAPPLWGSMRGIVVDASTRQPVPSAHVYLAEAERGRVANESGMFVFDRLLPGDYAVRVSHIGYRTTSRTIQIQQGGAVQSEIPIESQPVLLAPLVLEGLAMQPSSTLLGFAMMDQEDVTGSLGPGGALQGLDALMGVRVNDATADIHIQGGDAGEHQFRLDGAPVFIPLNVASFIGPFSPFALGSIRVNKAGFGAPLGSHISGVIEARHDLRYDPSGSALEQGFAGTSTVQADPLSINGRYSGALVTQNGTRASFMAATRIGLWNIAAPSSLTGLLSEWNHIDTFLLSAFADRNTPFADYSGVGSPGIGFADLHLAGEVKRGLTSLNGSVFVGGSRLGNDLAGASIQDPLDPDADIKAFKDIYEWRNATAQLGYDAVLTGRTLGSLQARFSHYRLRHDFVARDSITFLSPEDDGNRIYEVALSGKLDHALSDRHYTEAGAELVITGDRVRIAGSQQLPMDHSFTGWRLSTHVQDKIQVGRHLVVEAGSRFTFLAARRSLYAEPRLAGRLDFPGTGLGDVSLYFGSGIYRQFVNQFDVSSRSPRTFVSSTRFWMAVDSTIAPPKSGHVAGEILWRPTPKWSFSAETHYKRHYHILSIDYSASTASNFLTQNDFLRSSRGKTYGYGLVLKRSLGLGSVQARYEFTRGRRQISGLFEDRLLDVPWSEPHRFEISTNLMPVPRLVLLGRWRLIQGRNWGFRQAYYDFLGAHLNDLDRVLDTVISVDARKRIQNQIDAYNLIDPESHHLPDLIQLDLGAGYSFPAGPLDLQARLDVINVLGRTNTADWRFLYDQERFWNNPGTNGFLDKTDRELLPRVITFALRARW